MKPLWTIEMHAKYCVSDSGPVAHWKGRLANELVNERKVTGPNQKRSGNEKACFVSGSMRSLSFPNLKQTRILCCVRVRGSV